MSRCEGTKPGRSGRWLECFLSEPRDMVHPGPDSSDGCTSGIDRTAKGEHLLATAQTRCRARDDFSSTELVETQLVPQVGLSHDGWMDSFRPIERSTTMVRPKMPSAAPSSVWKGGGFAECCGFRVLIRESPGAARQRAERVVVVCGPWRRGSVSAECRTKPSSA